jgi:hypothetical protein
VVGRSERSSSLSQANTERPEFARWLDRPGASETTHSRAGMLPQPRSGRHSISSGRQQTHVVRVEKSRRDLIPFATRAPVGTLG